MKTILCSILIIWFLLALYNHPTIHIVNKKKKVRVVCSLTTRPTQPYYFKNVLVHLTNQFDAVYLIVPKISHKGVKYPYIHYPNVNIISVLKDYGPITKYFGALDAENDPNTLIVVLDDDILYSKNIRKQFENEHKKYPNAVLSGAGIVYKYYTCISDYRLSISGRAPFFPNFIPSFLCNKHTTTVAGYSGVAFRRGLIKKQKLLSFISKWGQNRNCFLNDDIVISAFFSQNKIKRLCVKVDDSKPPKDKDVESLSENNTKIQESQYKVFNHLKDCFANEPFRYDCVCFLDILLLICIVTLIIKINEFKNNSKYKK